MSAERPDGAQLTVAEQRIHIDEDLTALPTPYRRRLYAFAYLLLTNLAKLVFRLRVVGADNVPAGPFILAPVHRSNLDFALVLGCVPKSPRVRYLAKDTLWKGAWGKLWTALGAIPVHRGTPDREALATCVGVLEAGESLVMFPEGTRQSGTRVQELFDGPAYVQARTGVPIVPVGIGGSQAAMPKGAKFIRPARVVLTVGEPLAMPETNERGRVPRRAVRDQTAELRRVLQELFDDAQRLAG